MHRWLWILAACGGPDRVYPIAMIGDGTNVYIVDDVSGGTQLLRQPVEGGAFEVLATSKISAVFTALAADGAYVYYTFNPEARQAMQLYRVPVAGGAPELLASLPTILAVAIDDTQVYAAVQDELGTVGGTVVAIPKTGGDPIMLATFPTQQPVALAPTAADLVFATATTGGDGRPGDGHLFHVAKTGGTPSEIAIGTGFAPFELAVDAQLVYWLDAGFEEPSTSPRMFTSGALASVSLAGGTPTALVDSLRGPAGLVRDGDALYFYVTNEMGNELISEPGDIERVSSGGGAPTILAHADFPHGIAVDASNVVYLHGLENNTTDRVAK